MRYTASVTGNPLPVTLLANLTVTVFATSHLRLFYNLSQIDRRSIPREARAVAEPPRRLDRARAEWRTRHYGRLPDEAYHGTSERFQKLLRYADVKTTMIYTHVLGLGASGVRSPRDALGAPDGDSPSRADG